MPDMIELRYLMSSNVAAKTQILKTIFVLVDTPFRSVAVNTMT